MATVTLLVISTHRAENPKLPHGLWATIPFAFAVFVIHTAIRLTRHAYLILTPLGIEIFPFFRPANGMRLITWQEVAAAEVNEKNTRLTLHHNAEKSAGIHLSLIPIRADRRTLLAKAVIGRVSPPPTNG